MSNKELSESLKAQINNSENLLVVNNFKKTGLYGEVFL